MPPRGQSTTPDPYDQLPHDNGVVQYDYSQPYGNNGHAIRQQSIHDDVPGSLPAPIEDHKFIAPRLDTANEDASYKRRLIVWWGMRGLLVLLIVGLIGGGGYGVYRMVASSGEQSSETASIDGLNDDSRAPLSEWQCTDGETKDPNSDSMCIGEKDAVIPLEEIYSCPDGYTKTGTGDETVCEKPKDGAQVVTEALKVSYTCPAGFKREGATACSRVVSADSSVQNSCPAGYTASGAQCQKTTTVYAAFTTSCASGWVKTATNCTKTVSVTYTCSTGYQRSGTTCTDTIALKANGTCKTGYKKQNGKCIKTVAATVSCPAGYPRVGTTATCRASAVFTYSCPSNYTKSGSGAATKCSRTTVATAGFIQQRVCSAGYSLNGTVCYKTETQAARKTYSCSSGFTSTGGTCQKTISGEMEKKDPTTEDGCRDGYVKTDDEKQCRREDTEAHEGKLVQSCEEGWELKKTDSGALCYEKK